MLASFFPPRHRNDSSPRNLGPWTGKLFAPAMPTLQRQQRKWHGYLVNGEKQLMKKCRCLKNLVLILVFVFSSFSLLHATDDPELARWQREAGNVTIIRDDWGIAHV